MSDEVNEKNHAVACAAIWVAECKTELEAAIAEQLADCQKLKAERIKMEAEHAHQEQKMRLEVRRKQLRLERAEHDLALAQANKDRGFEV